MLRNRLLRLFSAAAIVFVAGCKEVLYSGLDEVEANQMIAVLQAAEIDSSRQMDNDGLYAVSVNGSQIGASVLLLQQEGLPSKKFADLGTVFADDGIVGTPFEERARFMYALNQELAQTVSNIEGVRSARVHVVLPEVARFEREARPASSAVVIYHAQDFDALAIVPSVKTLVAHAVPELNYQQVSVSLFPVGGPQLRVTPSQLPNAAEAATLENPHQVVTSLNRAQSFNLPLMFFIAGAIGLVLMLPMPFRKKRK